MIRTGLLLILFGLGIVHAYSLDLMASIPDTAFLHAIIDAGVDTSGDGLIGYAGAGAVQSLYIGQGCWCRLCHDYKTDIFSYSGIETFSNLKSLSLTCGMASDLDLSNCTHLKSLPCNGNELSGLNIEACKELIRLDCVNNQLSSLLVSCITDLKEWICGENDLDFLDISNNHVLEFLDIFYLSKLKEVCVFTTPFPPLRREINSSPSVPWTF